MLMGDVGFALIVQHDSQCDEQDQHETCNGTRVWTLRRQCIGSRDPVWVEEAQEVNRFFSSRLRKNMMLRGCSRR